MQHLSKQSGIVSLDAKEQKPLLEEFVKTYSHLYVSTTIATDGINIARSDDQALKDYSSRSWFQGAIAGKNITWQALISKTINKPAACLATPIRQQQIVAAVVKACSSLEEITKQVGAIKIGNTGYAMVVDNKGKVVAHPDKAFSTGNSPADFSNYPPVKSLLKGVEGHLSFTNEQGKDLISYSNLLENDWGVLIIQEKAELFLQKQKFQKIAWVITLCIVGLVGLIIFVIVNHLVEPITHLTQASSALAAGDRDRRVNLDLDDEIGILAGSFNKMAQQLQESLETLEDRVEERTAELAQANEQITALNEKLKEENLRMGAELDIARQLQQMVLPKPEELDNIEGIDVAGFMEAADEVGGDYYDVLYSDGVVTIGIGDVTGHGLESGILMLMTQTAVRTLQEIKENNPVRFLNILNRTVYQNVQRMDSEKNLTLSILNYSKGAVSISAQHEETLVVRSGGHVERVDTMDLGLPIGMDYDIADFIDQTVVKLNPGDGVVLYTDGIPEAFNIEKKQYGMKRLCEVVSQNWHSTAQEIEEAIIDDVHRFIGKQKVFDDITLLVLKQY